jgi:phage terminase small subunit
MLTPKQEAFCIAYLETGNASEAYRRAYDAKNMNANSINRKAKDLVDNVKITARLQELRAPVVERAQITLQDHLDELQRLRDAAKGAEKYGPAVTAEMARGKACGFYVEKVDVNITEGLAGRLARARARGDA